MFVRVVVALLLAAAFACGQTKGKSKAKAPVASKPVEQTGPVLLPPKDESGRDKTLAAFFVRLRDVLKRKDRAGLEALLAADVDSGSSTKGPSAFILGWGLQEPDGNVYAVITQVLSMPGVWQEDRFCGPYVVTQFPAELDKWKYQAVLTPDLKLHAEKSASSKVLATLSYNIVEILDRGDWAKIRTAAGQEGYVPLPYLYSSAAVSMCVAKDTEGAWRIQWLAPGRPR